MAKKEQKYYCDLCTQSSTTGRILNDGPFSEHELGIHIIDNHSDLVGQMATGYLPEWFPKRRKKNQNQ
jgi:hypothetical protein